jgi:hypothetical protein
MRKRFLKLVLLFTSCNFCLATFGATFSAPTGGWDYTYDGTEAVFGSPGTGNTSLDGNWTHDNEGDEWDGSTIGGEFAHGNRPGGVMALTEGDLTFLRMQDTGNPRDHGFFDPGSNRKLFFTHELELAEGEFNLFEPGFTFTFRARVPTSSTETLPLDPLHPDGGNGPVPYPETGDGYVTSEEGRGNFVVRDMFAGAIAFSLTVSNDVAGAGGTPVNFAGLTLNSFDGDFASPDVGYGEGQRNNALALDPTQWHEFWVVIQPDTSLEGTHRVAIYLDGQLAPNVFKVTAGTGSDYDFGHYIGMGLPSTPQSGALDVDFAGYKLGAHFPAGAQIPVDEEPVDPSVPGEAVKIETVSLRAGEVVFTFNAQAGKSYRVDFKESVTAPEWTPLKTISNVPTGAQEVTDAIGQNRQRFYQVIELGTGM